MKNDGSDGSCTCLFLWGRKLSARDWADVEFSVTGAKLGKKRGKYLLILFKMQGTDAVAVSGASWKVAK